MIVCIFFALWVSIANAQNYWDPNNPAHIEEYVIYVATHENVDVGKALAIAKCESRFNPLAVNYNPPKEISVGVFQINTLAHGIPVEQAKNPWFNINWAIDRMAEGKWLWWDWCFKKHFPEDHFAYRN